MQKFAQCVVRIEKKPHLERLIVIDRAASITQRRRTFALGSLNDNSRGTPALFQQVVSKPFSRRRSVHAPLTNGTTSNQINTESQNQIAEKNAPVASIVVDQAAKISQRRCTFALGTLNNNSSGTQLSRRRSVHGQIDENVDPLIPHLPLVDDRRCVTQPTLASILDESIPNASLPPPLSNRSMSNQINVLVESQNHIIEKNVPVASKNRFSENMGSLLPHLPLIDEPKCVVNTPSVSILDESIPNASLPVPLVPVNFVKTIRPVPNLLPAVDSLNMFRKQQDPEKKMSNTAQLILNILDNIEHAPDAHTVSNELISVSSGLDDTNENFARLAYSSDSDLD